MAKILVADDDAHVIRVMSLWLTRHGHQIFEASNGAKALEMLDELDVDLIISDVNMPGGGGVELLKNTREKKVDVPFLLITSRCDQKDLAGIVGPLNASVYPKPFIPSKLVAEIDRLLIVAT